MGGGQWGEVGFRAHSAGGDNLLMNGIQARDRRVEADSKVGGLDNGSDKTGMVWGRRAGVE